MLRIGHRIFVGLSRRTNRQGVEQLSELLKSDGYEVQAIEVKGCLHLKSACSYIGHSILLVNRSWIDPGLLGEFELIDVPEEEPSAATLDQLLGPGVKGRRINQRRTDAERAGFHFLPDELAHFIQLLWRGLFVFKTDDVFANRGRTDERGDIARHAALFAHSCLTMR